MRRHHRTWFSRFAPVAVAAVLTLAATACAPPGRSNPGTGGGLSGDTVAAVNQDRAASGLGPLGDNAQLTAYAQSWADHLAATGALTHTDLSALIRRPDMSGWWGMGENLLESSAGLSGAAAEDLWMASPEHRASILSPTFTHIGVAAAWDGAGRLWLVAEFGAR